MRWLHPLYHGTMAGLALAVLWLVTQPEEPWVRQANQGIWALFLVDYLLRLLFASGRRLFLRRNVPDLIAVLPLDYLLEYLLAENLFGIGRLVRLARFVRLVWLARAFLVLWRLSHNTRAILRTNGLGHVLMITAGTILIGGLGLWLVEPEIGSVGDGVWWSLVTTTTVGYGDISPSTTAGRVVAGILMIVGIGTISLITSSVTTYFLGRQKPSNRHVVHLITELERWDELSPEERRQLAGLLKSLTDS